MEGLNRGYGSGNSPYDRFDTSNGKGYGCGKGAGAGSYSDYGHGYGLGCGNGNGDGSGCCYGDNHGHAAGYSDSSGYGYGERTGIKIYNGRVVEIIDSVPTIIDRAHGRFARGWILYSDLTLSPCCVVRNEDGLAAHGKTMREAMNALTDKEIQNRTPEERVADFMESHEVNTKYPARDLFEWHHRLTGSCLAGRKAFCRDHRIDIDHDEFTPQEFVNLTRKSYGRQVIELLAERLGGSELL